MPHVAADNFLQPGTPICSGGAAPATSRPRSTPRPRTLIGPSAELWSIDDAAHIKGPRANPDDYERRVVGFFDDALLGGNHPG
jgi:hypothetical protein